MNCTEEKIKAVLASVVCDACDPLQTAWDCDKHGKKCNAMFRNEAKAVYEQIVKPLEDRLEDDGR